MTKHAASVLAGVCAALIVGGVIFLVVKATNVAPVGHLAKRDYTQDVCRHIPARTSLLAVHGFKPLSPGEVALQSTQEATGGSVPAVIYIWGTSNRCIVIYSLEGGP
jgi:hypothetical protein